ncbi:MAG: FHA domain-containing protein [Ruminococcaceae bacterium]|nr:FHA domain-containing protein [Oscillospiraceae bacterium]
MSETTKLIIFVLAAVVFLVGAVILAVILFGSSKKKSAPAPRSMQDFDRLPVEWQAAEAQSPVAQQGKISYGNATQAVGAAALMNAAPHAGAVPPVNAAFPANAARHGSAPKGMRGVPDKNMAIRLTITGDNGAPEYFVDVLRSELPVIIGRGRSDARGRSIVVNEPTVSFQHVCLEEKNGVISVRDCRSTCGTVIDGGDGGSVVLKNEAKETSVSLYAGSFTMILGRMKVRAELSEAFRASARVGCRLTVKAICGGAPAGGGTYHGSFSIGRQGVELILRDLMVSRLHAKVQLTVDGRFILRDQGSRNGVFDARSGSRITEAELKNGSVIRVGDTELHVENVVCGIPGSEMPPRCPRTVYVDSISSVSNPRFI